MPERTPVIYLRKSNLANADNDLNAHERRALAKMQERGESNPIIIAEPEGHRSGFTDNRRPGYQQVQQLIAADKVSALFINDRARIWRNAMEYIQFLMFCVQHQTEVVPSIEAPIGDVSDPTQQLLEFIQGWQNEQYRNRISNSLKATKRDLREAGLPSGNRGNFGLELVGSMFGRHYEPNADFPNWIQVLKWFAYDGLSPEQLAIQMKKHDMPWRVYGKPVQAKESTIRAALKHVERYKDFLDPQLYRDVLDERERRAKPKTRKRHARHGNSLLTGVLSCAKCGMPYYTDWRNIKDKPGQTRNAYFHRENINCDARPRYISQRVLDKQFRDELYAWRDYLEQNKERIIAAICADSQPPPTPDTALRRAKLEQRLKGYAEMRADGDISKEQYRQHKEAIEAELATLEPVSPDPLPEVLTPDRVRLLLTDILDELRKGISNQTVRRIVRTIRVSGTKISVDWGFYIPTYA